MHTLGGAAGEGCCSPFSHSSSRSPVLSCHMLSQRLLDEALLLSGLLGSHPPLQPALHEVDAALLGAHQAALLRRQLGAVGMEEAAPGFQGVVVGRPADTLAAGGGREWQVGRVGGQAGGWLIVWLVNNLPVKQGR